MKTRLFASFVALLCLSVHARAQSFDVASVKPSAPDSHTETRRSPGGRFTATGVTLRALIQRAYDLQDFQILGGPKWMDSDHFDIEARSGSDDSNLNLKIQALLSERFGLKAHRDTRQLPEYTLTVAKDGLRLPRNTSGKGPTWSLGRGMLTGEKISMEMLASDLLQHALHQPVEDRTGVGGEFDLKLFWTPDDAAEADLGSQPSFFTAIREQLGLQLEQHKGVVNVLIVDDGVKPSAN